MSLEENAELSSRRLKLAQIRDKVLELMNRRVTPDGTVFNYPDMESPAVQELMFEANQECNELISMQPWLKYHKNEIEYPEG